MDEEKEVQKIGMLLDIANLYGEHEGRLAPWLYALGLGLGPTLVYVYLQLFLVIPFWLWVPINVFWFLRMIMIFPGREKHRVRIFKRQLNDEYMESANLMNIKVIHPDGCIEYINGQIMYLVSCFNGTIDNDVNSTIQLRKMLESMTTGYAYDIYIHNINDSQSLRDYYNKVNKFAHNQSASNFIHMIDHSIKITNEGSMVLQTIYAIRGTKSDWKNIKSQIDSTLNSRVSRRYKNVYRVSDPDEISAIFNRNTDTIIDISALMRKKYATSEYATSKVLAYDLPDDKVIVQGEENQNPVLPEQTPQSFHVVYKEQ